MPQQEQFFQYVFYQNIQNPKRSSPSAKEDDNLTANRDVGGLISEDEEASFIVQDDGYRLVHSQDAIDEESSEAHSLPDLVVNSQFRVKEEEKSLEQVYRDDF